MPASRLWRITGIDARGSGALELSALHLYGSAGRLDATATLGCSHPPASGTLAALQDADPETLCAFAADKVRAPGFWLQWDFGAGNTADVWGLRVGAGTSQALFLSTCFLQYFDGSAWVAAQCGAYPWPGAGGLAAAPSGPVAFGGEVGVFIERTAAGSRNWYSAAMSADGLRIVAGASGGYLYTSTDGGATWTERTAAGSRNWYSAAMSADGLRIVAGVSGGYLYTSTDGGATWTERTAVGSRNWLSAAMSADGLRIVAGASGGYLYTSTDGGATWTERTAAGSRNWYSAAMSADGLRIVAGAYGGYLYTSTDGGATWTERTAVGSRNWYSAAMSADGLRIVAGAYGGYLYTSTDGGATWTERTAVGSRNWLSADMSADGLRIVAGVSGGYLYTSTDGGATWTERTAVGSRNWYSAAMSADGQRIVAGVSGGYLYTSTLRASDAIEPTLRATTRATAPVFTRATGNLRTLGGQRQQLARDTAHGGNGTVTGTVDRKGTPANVPLRRRVRLHSDASGALVRETWSDAATGAFAFTGIDPAQRYTTIAYDYEHNFRAEAADNLTPEVPA